MDVDEELLDETVRAYLDNCPYFYYTTHSAYTAMYEQVRNRILLAQRYAQIENAIFQAELKHEDW